MNAHDVIFDWNTSNTHKPFANRHVELCDESLRDGLQSPSVRDPAIEQKCQMLKLMDGNRWTRSSVHSELQWWNGTKSVIYKEVSPINALGEGSHNGEIDSNGNVLLATAPRVLPADIAAVIGQPDSTAHLGDF